MIVSHRHRFVFLKTKKSAGTSVELALSAICGPEDIISPVSAEDEAMRLGRGVQNIEIPVDRRPVLWRLHRALGARPSQAGMSFYNHMTATEARAALGAETFDAYRKVTIVRNPWDREVSLYFWHHRGKDSKPAFDRFVRMPRWRPDRKNFDLYSIGGRPVADDYLRYETLADDFAGFVRSLGVADVPGLPRAKGVERPRAKRDFREFYTPATRDIVGRRYAREIELFGYTFD